MWLDSFWDWYHDNGIIPNLWKGFTGQKSEQKIAQQNLDYQENRNEIEDARYSEETAYNRQRDAIADKRYWNELVYNRQFAEDERDYSRSRDTLADERYAEELGYNRAFAEDERDYNREFAEGERDYAREFAEDERTYSRERDAIADARYEDELAYNRALQQEIFEREDTAITRQANELSKLGINPLSQGMNGLGAGSVVSATGNTAYGGSSYNGSHYGGSSAPGSAGSTAYGGSSAPGSGTPTSSARASNRGGQALHSQERVLTGITPILSLINQVDSVKGNIVQRDALALQNDAQYLANLDTARKLNIKYTPSFNYKNLRSGKASIQTKDGTDYFDTFQFEKSRGINLKRDMVEGQDLKHKFENKIYSDDPNFLRSLKSASDVDLTDLTERVLTSALSAMQYASDSFKNRDDNGDNALSKLFKLIF